MSRTLFAAAAASCVCLAGSAAAPQAAWAAPAARSASMNTLPRAIAAVERSTGGKVLEIREARNGGFDAVVSTGAAIIRVNVREPFSGITSISETERPAWMKDWDLRADGRSIMKAKVPLARAVRQAEKMTSAPAVDAELAAPLTGSNNVLAYKIETLKNGQPDRVAIDARDGSPIANPDALLKTWSPEHLTSAGVD